MEVVGFEGAVALREAAHDAVARGALGTAASTPSTCPDDPTREDRSTQFDPLPDDFEPEPVQPAERGQIRTVQGNVAHSRGLSAGWRREPPSWKTSTTPQAIPIPPGRPTYTLIREEPVWADRPGVPVCLSRPLW